MMVNREFMKEIKISEIEGFSYRKCSKNKKAVQVVPPFSVKRAQWAESM